MSLAWGLFFCRIVFASSAAVNDAPCAALLSSSLGGDASVFSFLAACFALYKP